MLSCKRPRDSQSIYVPETSTQRTSAKLCGFRSNTGRKTGSHNRRWLQMIGSAKHRSSAMSRMALVVLPFLLSTCVLGQKPDPLLRPIKHIIVIYQENWSFDS